MNAEFPVRHTKKLLRDLSRRLFLKADGEWTSDPDEAKDFTDLQQLLAACDAYEIRDGEVVEHVVIGDADVNIPVRSGGDEETSGSELPS